MMGREMHGWATDLFPLNRSLSGEGNRQTLRYLKRLVPELDIREFKSGEVVFDWVIPDEWNVKEAYIETLAGARLVDFNVNNLHLVGYSQAIDRVVEKEELFDHLHFVPELPDAIPYVTSYYSQNWGFCLSKNQLKELGNGPFKVFIDSTFKSGAQGGSISYGEIFLPGISKLEILFSTYICHPSMANNELSGPVIATALAKLLRTRNTHFSYRFLFLPETIGAISYISKNLQSLKESVVAGWVLTCLGDAGEFSYIPSRTGDNFADRITRSVLQQTHPSYLTYSWLDRGSDERQYCAPGVDLPICSVTRSKYATYSGYHTSLDDLSFISEHSLSESLSMFLRIIDKVESCRLPKIRVLCEPQLGKRGLYSNISTRESYLSSIQNINNILSYLDGNHTIQDIAAKCNLEPSEVELILDVLMHHELISI